MVLHGVLIAALLAGGEGPEFVKRLPSADGRCFTNSPIFQVPYDLENAPTRTSLLKPALYYSNDAGKHWHLGAIDVDGVSPATFHAPEDGEYWLRMGLRRLGQIRMPDLGRDRDGVLVAVVDTRPPKVELVPRLVYDEEQGPAVVLRVVLEDEPLEPPDIAIEVELPATEEAPAGRHLWIERAEVGREYRWVLEPRRTSPAAFHAVAVDQAGNSGSDVLQMSMLARQAGLGRLAQAEIVQPRVVRAVTPPADVSEALAAVVDYTVAGPPLGEDEVVELWATDDNGQTWRVSARHEDRSRPLVFSASRPGLYGLRLVLRRGQGFVGGLPTAGTKPQVYVVMERAAEDAQVAAVRPAGATRLGPAAGANVPTDLSVEPTPAPAASQPQRCQEPSVRVPDTLHGPGPDRAGLAQAAYQRGNYLRLQGRWAEACHEFREAIRHDPKHFEAHNDLAGCLHHLDRFEEAARAYYQAIDVRPGQADARFNLARTLIGLGRLDEALSQLDEVVRLNPTDGEAWLYRGELLLRRRGNVAAARTCWRKALEQAPGQAGWSALARRRLTQHPPGASAGR